jgi:aryl-alcohol dehydrogenase-like predicted oxidoreductase
MINNIVLGTARWGSHVEQNEVHKLLDKFVSAGGQFIDASTNYPINGVAQDLGLSNRILAKWINHNPGVRLNVLVKIGSVNNSGGPENDLSGRALQGEFERLKESLGNSLGGIGVHWDNRGYAQRNEICETTLKFSEFHHEGFRIGISGIKDKEGYRKTAPWLQGFWEIQIKFSGGELSSRNEYQKFFPNALYLGYGISRHGDAELSFKNKDLSDLDLSLRADHKENLYLARISSLLESSKVQRVIIGPRTLGQLDSVINHIDA